jgi:hypothetical protein
MMAKRILVMQGLPVARGSHFGNALADAFVKGAEEAGAGT